MKKALFSSAVLLAALACSGSAKGALLKSYDFNGNLADTLGNGVDLTDSGGSIGGGRYSFTNNQGLRLTSALPSTTDYGIEIRLQVNDDLSSYNKLIDFQDLTTDHGLYVYSGGVHFYSFGPGPGGTIAQNTDFTVGLARSGGSIEVFLNGVSLYTAVDGTNQAVSAGNILNFFEDDFFTGQGEAFVGSVEFIRIHNDATTFGATPLVSPAAVPEPTTLILASLGVLGCVALARRHKTAA